MYVVKEVAEAVTPASTAGSISVNSNDAKTQMYFTYKGAASVMRSDLIPVDCIMYAKQTSAAAMKMQLKTVTVSLVEAPKAGEDYILRINIMQAFGKADDHTYQKFGAVRATSGMSAAQFWTAMKDSLERNFSKELTKWFNFAVSGDSLVIAAAEQPWVPGKLAKENVYFEVLNCYIKDAAGVEVEAFATTNDGKTVGTVTYTPEAHNDHVIMDQEIFYMGERGDQYRMGGWPKNIDTTYLATAGQDYDALDIHYCFVDSNEGVQKSEKDIYIVGSASAISALVTEINTVKAGLIEVEV